MSQEESQIESLLLKERWMLLQARTERKAIRICGNKIFVKNELLGQIIKSSFVSLMHNQLKLKWTLPVID